MYTWISKVETTYNGRPRTYELAPHTLVVGPHGAGKTTLLASLGLLLTGRADDAVGRDEVAAAADLALAMGEAEGGIGVRATMGQDSLVEAEPQTFTYKLPRGSRPECDLSWEPWRHPIRAFSALLAQNAVGARRDLAPILLSQEPVDCSRQVVPQVLDYIKSLAGAVSFTLPELVDLIDRVDQGAANAERSLKAAQASSTALEQALPKCPSDSEVETARQVRDSLLVNDRAFTTWQANRSFLQSQVEQHAAMMARIQKEHAFVVTEYPKAVAEQRALEARSDAPTPKLVITPEQRATLGALGTLLKHTTGSTCPVCRTASPVVIDLRGHVAALTELDARPSVAVGSEAQNAASRVDHLKAEADRLSRSYQAAAQQHQSASAALAAVGAAPPDVSRAAQAAQSACADLEAAQATWSRAQRLRAEVLAAEGAVAVQKLAVDELRRVLDNVYRERIAEAEERVSAWLPKGWRIQIVLNTPRGSPTFRLAVRLPDGTLSTNPSGGERAALVLALVAYAAAEGRLPTFTGPTVLMLPQERGFSPALLSAVMSALSACPVQVIIVSLTKPKGAVPKGWKMLNLGETEAVQAPASAEAPAAEAK